MKKLLCLVIFALGCTPSTIDEYRREGESLAIAIASELKKVETKADLEACGPKIKKKLDKLTDLMIASQKIAIDAPKEVTYGSQQLKKEQMRIYSIEGGKETFEAICSEALQKIQLNLR